MSTARKPVIAMTMKLRTLTMTMDFQGSTSDGIELAFCALQSKPNTRAKLLGKLAAQHQEMLQREAQLPVAATAKATGGAA